MNTKKSVLLLIIILIVLGGIFVYYESVNASITLNSGSGPSTTVSVKFVSSTITADGAVTAANQARLNFQIGGKLTYLPFKEGDTVSAGQTIAQLDTYELQQELQLAANNYQIAKNGTNQASEKSAGRHFGGPTAHILGYNQQERVQLCHRSSGHLRQCTKDSG